jgi:hypothetical protein
MAIFWQIFIGLAIVYVVITIVESIQMPKPRHIKIVTLFGKLYTVIANVEGKKINKTPGPNQWDLVDLGPNEKTDWNIYFIWWPFFKIYKYQFAYTKLKKIGEEEPDDVVVWKDENTKECVISRTGISDHVEYRQEYPIVTASLDTKEMATVNIFTMSVLETVNVVKMLLGVTNWFSLAIESLNGIFRGLVAKRTLPQLNALSSEDRPEFNSAVLAANKDQPDHPGLLTFGVKVIKSVFKDFEPVSENAKTLMASLTDIEIARNTGEADLEKQKKLTEAYRIKTDMEINQAKKRLGETGRIKLDKSGNIIELVPDPDTKTVAENLGKLKDLKGTLVIGDKTTNMLNLKQRQEGGEE